MSAKQLPSPELLRKLLRYEPDTGKLYWLERSVCLFNDNDVRACRTWNKRFAGNEAFTADNGDGYKMGRIFGHPYTAHRVIWVIVHNEWPDNIDHINGIRDDNRIVNLRSVSKAENGKNQRLKSNNKSGVCGVHFSTREMKWICRIDVNGKQKHIGTFDNINDAEKAIIAAKVKYGYHKNHGTKTIQPADVAKKS